MRLRFEGAVEGLFWLSRDSVYIVDMCFASRGTLSEYLTDGVGVSRD